MATNYFVVMTAWPIGQAVIQQGVEMLTVTHTKAYNMVIEGKLVRPDCPTKHNTLEKKYLNNNPVYPIMTDVIHEYGRVWFSSWSVKHQEEILSGAVGTHSDTRLVPNGLSIPFSDGTTEPRGFRIFTSEAAANEWIDFILSLGAQFSVIISQEDIDKMDILPDDSIIAQYIGTPA